MKIYSRRHPMNAVNRQTSLLEDLHEYAKSLPELLERLKMPRSITTIKPDRAPPRIMADQCEGLHPTFTKDYLRKTIDTSGISKVNVSKLVGLIKGSLERADLEAKKL